MSSNTTPNPLIDVFEPGEPKPTEVERPAPTNRDRPGRVSSTRPPKPEEVSGTLIARLRARINDLNWADLWSAARLSRPAQAVAALTVVLVLAYALLAACGGEEPPRSAKEVGPSTVPSADADLDAVVIGWGQRLAAGEITHPRAGDITASCMGRGDKLRVKLTTEQGWTVLLSHGVQVLRVENSKLGLPQTDLDAGRLPIPTPQIDWTQTDEIDLAVRTTAPATWPSQYGPGQPFVLSAHIDCRS